MAGHLEEVSVCNRCVPSCVEFFGKEHYAAYFVLCGHEYGVRVWRDLSGGPLAEVHIENSRLEERFVPRLSHCGAHAQVDVFGPQLCLHAHKEVGYRVLPSAVSRELATVKRGLEVVHRWVAT